MQDGDEWVINGQKIYTCLASYADYIWLAARTDPDAPEAQGHLDLPRADHRPGLLVLEDPHDGERQHVNTFYDDVRVRRRRRSSTSVNQGWDLITNQLNYERVVARRRPGMVERVYDEVRRWAQETKLPDGRRVIDQEWVQLNLARVHAKLEFLKLINWKVAAAGGANPADASATKVFGTEFFSEAYRLLMEILGPDAYAAAASSGAAVLRRPPRARLPGHASSSPSAAA